MGVRMWGFRETGSRDMKIEIWGFRDENPEMKYQRDES